jgi:hypothetical protein
MSLIENVNFCFVRHGYSCSNSLKQLVKNDVINIDDRKLLSNSDPELTPIGVDASINNGCVIGKIIKKIYTLTGKPELNIEKINIVGCSPLIRAMETAYYMTRKWNNPPNKIYVFPLLREIDESSDDKYSEKSKNIIDKTPGYAMKSIKEQKEYLKNLGILDFFDFTFVEEFPGLRKEPGDIIKFISWFYDYFLPDIKHKGNLNLFITTHAGVLKDFSEEGFVNNSGFLMNTKTLFNKGLFIAELKHFVSFNNFLPKFFFKDYSNPIYNTKDYFCPNNRCGQLCTLAKTSDKESIFGKKIKIECSIEKDDL